MREFSMTVTLVAVLALAGCSDGAKEVKGEKGDVGEKGEPGSAVVRGRRDYDQCLLQRHVQCLSAGPADQRRALRQQSQFDHVARHDRVRKTLVRPPSVGGPRSFKNGTDARPIYRSAFTHWLGRSLIVLEHILGRALIRRPWEFYLLVKSTIPPLKL